MKCFMPVYALALALAGTSDMVQQVSAAACVSDTVCGTPTDTCTPVANGKTAAEALVYSGAACSTGKYAYIKSISIIPDTSTSPATAFGDITVAFTKDGSAPVLATSTAATTPGACDTSFANIGSDTTAANVRAIVGCKDATTCNFKYKVEWACQVDSCAISTTNCPSCKSESVPFATGTNTLALEKPSSVTCATGKFAYLKSLTVGADTAATPATSADKIAVTFAGATGLTATKSTSTCDGKWADVGKAATLTADVKATVTCTNTAACAVKWVGEWACQTAVSTSGSSTGNTTAPSVTPASTPAATKSGVAALAGANPVVVWGTALVAAVAGANFAAPL